MGATLADYFFIAGLEGHEPAILNNPPPNTLKQQQAGATTKEETTKEELGGTSTRQDRPYNGNAIRNDPPLSPAPLSPLPSLPAIDVPPLTPDSDQQPGQRRDSKTFEDVIAQFASERDEFLLTLGGPTIPLTPRSTTPARELRVSYEEENDKVPELNRPPSPLRQRASLRNRLAELSRRASSRVSRSGTLRRGNTQCMYP
jgi:hypothetical protein